MRLPIEGKLTSPTYADCFNDFKITWGAHYERLLPVEGNHDVSDDPTGNVYQDYFKKRLKALGAEETQFLRDDLSGGR